jgi:quinol monooxygenase YgiN
VSAKEPAPDPSTAGPLARLLPDRFGMVVRLEAHPGGRPAILDALHRYADHLDDEPATELFVISVDPDEDEVVWLHEWFHEEAGVEAHQAAPAFAELMRELSASLASPPGVMRFQPLRIHAVATLMQDEPL